MKTKFKVGDKVLLTSRGIAEGEKKDWSLGGSQPDQYKIHFNTPYAVIESHITAGIEFIELEGMLFTHPASKFEIKPDVLTIVLRRPADRKSIEKFLKKNGYTRKRGKGYGNKEASRIIQVHLTGHLKGEVTYNGQMGYENSTKEAIDHTTKFLKGMWKYENIKVLKSKPSVSKLIEQIKKYI